MKDVIEKITNRPDDRRIIMCAWNPPDIKKMALPPCHCFVQFYVANGELSCQLYQRSADVGLGSLNKVVEVLLFVVLNPQYENAVTLELCSFF